VYVYATDGGAAWNLSGGFGDPADERIQQLAVGVYSQAGWIGTPQGVAAFYGASLAGALAVYAGPAVAQWGLNASGLLGSAANRVFWSGIGSAGAARWALANGGTSLESSPLGDFADTLQVLLPKNGVTGAV
jgi:hypothetical protein